MKWLTIDYIKTHSRIDFDCEDSLLELYGESAEETVLDITRRTYEEIVEKWGTKDKPIPAKIIHASLLLVDLSYQYRSPVSQQNLYTVPYAFDMLIKPFMKLADDINETRRRNEYEQR
jgi:uncharacterized phage protein (predicted DNA packaging)